MALDQEVKRDSNKKPVKVVGLVIDVTRQKEIIATQEGQESH